MNKAGNTEAVKAFINYMTEKGYLCGVYASDISGFRDKLHLSELWDKQKWVARYGSEPKYCRPYQMWQASSKGNIDGIYGHIDIDYCNIDYAQYIVTNHYNGF